VGICDHDTVAGVADAVHEGECCGVHVVPGVEINTDYEGREVHVLGYYAAAPAGSPFGGLLARLRKARDDRVREIVARLRRSGVEVSLGRVLELAGGGSAGRPHVARALVEAGSVRSTKEAFGRYLGSGRPGYVERYKLSPHDAVTAILRAGGVPVLAHPALVGGDNLIDELCSCGLMGLEAYHPDHSAVDVARYLDICRRRGLLFTGGSDCHGPGPGRDMLLGTVTVPNETVAALESARREMRRTTARDIAPGPSKGA